jgi:hypothetical protein
MFLGGVVELVEVTDVSVIKSYIRKLYSELFGASAVPCEESLLKIFSELPQNTHFAYEVKKGNDVLGFFTLGESFSVLLKVEMELSMNFG